MAVTSASDVTGKPLLSGMVMLDATGCVAEISVTLARWLGMSEAELRGKHFWMELWRRQPDWESPVAGILWRLETFSCIDLGAKGANPLDGYTLEIARHREGCFVRIGRIGPSKETNESEGEDVWADILTKLANSLVHDFNNLMAGLAMLGEAYHLQTDEGVTYPEGMTIIKANAAKARRVLEHILDLHRSKAGKRDFYDLNELVREAVELAQKLAPARVKIDLGTAPESLPVEVDRVAFRRMILEFTLRVANALSRGGVLRLETLHYDRLPPGEELHGVAPSVPGVCLTVRGVGVGITPVLLADIFNKAMPAGQTVATGLPGIRLFLEAHRAAITVQSVEEGGPAFCLWLANADFKAESM